MNNTSDIREVLMNEIESLVKGTSDSERAKRVAELSAQAIYATRVELENKRIEVDIGKTTGDMRWDKIDGLEVTIPTLTMRKDK